jgi:hypothetical protein
MSFLLLQVQNAPRIIKEWGSSAKTHSQKVVRMKTFAILFAALFLFHGQIAHAQYDDGFDVEIDDPSDGNDIPDPVIADYIKATRTPGFSVAYDIVTPDQITSSD